MLTIDDIKAHLRIDYDDDDALLRRLLASATAECLRYLGQNHGSEAVLCADVQQGIVLMVQADYDGDPIKRNQARDAAMALWAGHCSQFGV